jgi:hypothetical protein
MTVSEAAKLLLMDKILAYVRCMKKAAAYQGNEVTVNEVCDGVADLIMKSETEINPN